MLLIIRYHQHYPTVLAQLTVVKWDEITPIGKATYNFLFNPLQLTIRGENVPVAKEELGTSPNHLKQAIEPGSHPKYGMNMLKAGDLTSIN